VQVHIVVYLHLFLYIDRKYPAVDLTDYPVKFNFASIIKSENDEQTICNSSSVLDFTVRWLP